MANIDPAIYDQILSAGQQSADLDPQIANQMAIAQRLRVAGQMPGLIHSGGMYGGRTVAPSKWAYLASMANNAVAGQQDQTTMGMQKQQSDLRMKQVQAVIAALRGSPNTPDQQSFVGVNPDYGNEGVGKPQPTSAQLAGYN